MKKPPRGGGVTLLPVISYKGEVPSGRKRVLVFLDSVYKRVGTPLAWVTKNGTYKNRRGWTSGQSLPVLNVVEQGEEKGEEQIEK